MALFSKIGGATRRSSREDLFSGSVLFLGAAGALAVCLVTVIGGEGATGPQARRFLFAGGALLIAAVLLAALRLRQNARTTLAVTLVSVVSAAYLAEGYLRWDSLGLLWSIGHRLGLPYDGRTRLELIQDLRRAGENVWPEPHPILLMGRAAGKGILPLGGISNMPTVLCNEVGTYVLYKSDERGFRNPPGTWSTGEVQVAAVGDSFTQGMCVKDDENAVALLRRTYPRTLNLGMGGDGPLLELATLREYLPDLKPARVLWFFFEGNDLVADLEAEKKNPFLTRYLEENYRQGLGARQEEIDTVLEEWMTQEYLKAEQKSSWKWDADFWREFLKLRALRQSAGLLLPASRTIHYRVDIPLFRRVLEEASRTVSSWDGRLYLVYLPCQNRYRHEEIGRAMDEVKGDVLAVLHDLNIPLIDLQPVFAGRKVSSFYYPRPFSHFTPEGYRLVGETILQALSDENKRAGGDSSGPLSSQ